MSKTMSLYEEAQIILAGIRLYQHRESRFPSLNELAEFTQFSKESTYHLCNRLENLGAIERIQGTFDERFFLKDPLQAEALRKDEDKPNIDEDIKKRDEEQENSIKEIEKKFSKDHEDPEKEDLFSQLEGKVKKGGQEDLKSPLDAIFRTDMDKEEK